MNTEINRTDVEKELPVKNERKEADRYEGLGNSTQTFGAIGMFEVSGGDVILRGREGERDHIYPLHRAVKMYYRTEKMIMNLLRNGIRGWDVLVDVNKDFKEKIKEAVAQRATLNRSVPAEVMEFVQKDDAGAIGTDLTNS